MRVLTHIKKLDDCFGQFLVRVSCACGSVREMEPEGPGAPGWLESGIKGARTTDALLEVRQEGSGSHGRREAEAQVSAQEPALTSVRLASVTQHFAVLVSIHNGLR